MAPQVVTPPQWQAASPAASEAEEAATLPPPGWLAQLHDARLTALVTEALRHNPDLAAAREQLEQSRQALRISRAARLPLLGLSFSGDRAESEGRSFSLATDLSWDPDLWGELRAEQRQAQLEYAAAAADLRHQQATLAADISRTWFQLQEAQLLQTLYRERSTTLERDLETIEFGYRQGLYEALDLYLARNDVNAQQADLAEQTQLVAESRRTLELLLGRYPAAAITTRAELPLIAPLPEAGLPAQMVARRPDLQASWLQLLAADQALAAAHRARFPDFTLTAAYGGSSEVLSNLVSSGNLAWTLGASLAQTLFDGGQRAAEQARQAARRRELEQSYLSALYAAFAEVENALSAAAALQQQHQLYQEARDNAIQAEQLAFERYQRGLETYTTVLEAQRRSLDAQTSVIRLRRALLENQVDLALALGGPFAATPNQPFSDTTESFP